MCPPHRSERQSLLELVEGDFQRPHYKKGLKIAELFDEERRQLGPLPAKPFIVERFSSVRTNGYGKFCIEGRHWYSSSPELALRELTIGTRANSIVVYREDGEVLSTHWRVYGEGRSGSTDYLTSLETLVKRPGAWLNSALRARVGEPTREALDALGKTDLRRVQHASAVLPALDAVSSLGFTWNTFHRMRLSSTLTKACGHYLKASWSIEDQRTLRNWSTTSRASSLVSRVHNQDSKGAYGNASCPFH
jgi:hypothetical protein